MGQWINLHYAYRSELLLICFHLGLYCTLKKKLHQDNLSLRQND